MYGFDLGRVRASTGSTCARWRTTLADYKALTGQDLMTQGVGGAAVGAVDQEGARVVVALPATAPYQDPLSGATTTGSLVTLTVRDRP